MDLRACGSCRWSTAALIEDKTDLGDMRLLVFIPSCRLRYFWVGSLWKKVCWRFDFWISGKWDFSYWGASTFFSPWSLLCWHMLPRMYCLIVSLVIRYYLCSGLLSPLAKTQGPRQSINNQRRVIAAANQITGSFACSQLPRSLCMQPLQHRPTFTACSPLASSVSACRYPRASAANQAQIQWPDQGKVTAYSQRPWKNVRSLLARRTYIPGRR